MRNLAKLGSLVAGVALLATATFSGTALAGPEGQPVGTPGTAVCHGLRVSHGANHSSVQEGHGLTPGERAAALSHILGRPVSVSEFHQFVRFSCDSPGPQTNLFAVFE
jgi:hypothetical protein